MVEERIEIRLIRYNGGAMRKAPRATLSLNQAVALLIQNQAAFISEMRERDRTEREIRAILLRHEQRLNELTEMIRQLPEAIRQKIGFKPR